MTEQVIDKSTASILILILPFAIGVVFLYFAWPWLLGALVLAIGVQIWQQYQWRRLGNRLNPIFNQLLHENQGCLTAVDLAIKADLPIELAQRFLEQQTARYGGQRKTDTTHDTAVYYFLSASALEGIFAADAEATTIDVEAMDEEQLNQIPDFAKVASPRSLSLIQAELAKRLDVHSGTITKRKNDPTFPEWSCKKDPDGIAWRYAPKQKLFVPLDLSTES